MLFPILSQNLDISSDSLSETRPAIKNVGWTLGNECPYRCRHCYSMAVREKGKDLTLGDVDRIVDQLARNKIETVNLGGNEPLFTNGMNPKKTLLPYIIRSLRSRGIIVGLTSAGVTVNYLVENYPQDFSLLNDVDISFDSPFPEEHNVNRGAPLFNIARTALQACMRAGIDHTVVTCGMNWNLSPGHIRGFIELARETSSFVRVNFIKPTEADHLCTLPSPRQFYEAAEQLLASCSPIDLGESLISSSVYGVGKGCPCGVTSLRINSITPDGKVPVSPCVYLHDFRSGNLLEQDLSDIIDSPPFRAMRKRHANPHVIDGCSSCTKEATCRGGCAARAYLASNGSRNLYLRDPYCSEDYGLSGGQIAERPTSEVPTGVQKTLVHRDYLCTLIVSPS